MKLASFEVDGRDVIGVAVGDTVADIGRGFERLLRSRGMTSREAAAAAAAVVPDDMTQFIERGDVALGAAREVATFAAGIGATADFLHRRDDVRWKAPVPAPSKIFAVAVNGADLVKEAAKLPPYPVYFNKPPSTLVGHGAAIELPGIGTTIPEAELAVVIGKRAKNIAADDAYEYVYGYSIANDVTSPAVRKEDLLISRIGVTDPATGETKLEDVVFTAIARHKGMDTFLPMGPWLVTRDEIPDPHALTVDGTVDGRSFTHDHTSRLRFHVPQVLARISLWSTLMPGDIVIMGSASPSADWPMGDVDLNQAKGAVVISIEGLGSLENRVLRK